MTIEELNIELENANSIIENWNRSNGNVEDLPEAIYKALEENRIALIKYLSENQKWIGNGIEKIQCRFTWHNPKEVIKYNHIF